MPVFESPEPLRERLRPTQFHALVEEAVGEGRSLLLGGSVGLGKTEAVCRYLRSGLYRNYADVVVIALNSRKQMTDVAERLRRPDRPDDPDVVGLTVVVYPSVEDAPCAPNPTLAEAVKRHQGAAYARSTCRTCDDAKKCPFIRRTKTGLYKEADVIIVSEQLFGVRSDILVQIVGRQRYMLVLDEALCANAGFVQTFTQTQVDANYRVADNAGMMRTAAFFQKLSGAQVPAVRFDASLAMTSRHLSLAGEEAAPKVFTSVLHDAVAWVQSPAADRWRENDVYAYRCCPQLPPVTVILGAYLTPEFIADRFCCPPPVDPLGGHVVVNPDSTIINCQTKSFSKRLAKGSRMSIAALIADIIIQYGKRTVILTSKNSDEVGGPQFYTDIINAVRAALAKRGVTDRVFVEWTAVTGNPKEVAVLTYGQIGSNRIEDFEVLIASNAYYVSERTLKETAFGHLPPSRRPALRIQRDRTVVVGDGLDRSLNEHVGRILFRLETDVMLQAVGRVRYATKDRLVIMSSWASSDLQVPGQVVVNSLGELRHHMGLQSCVGTVAGPLHDQVLALARAGSRLGQIAEAVRRSISWVRSVLRGHPDIKMARGRPGGNNVLLSTYTTIGGK